MRYVKALIDKNNREEAYRIYVTKSLQLIPQNKMLSVSYTDLLKPQVRETKNGDEIAIDIISRFGLKFKE